jgi:hypothetical protein
MLEIIGYQEEHGCEHCNRWLKHGIVLSNGKVVGATCFDKKLTQPLIDKRTGKKYRLGSELIIKLAKVARLSPERQSQLGYGVHHFRFEAA